MIVDNIGIRSAFASLTVKLYFLVEINGFCLQQRKESQQHLWKVKHMISVNVKGNCMSNLPYTALKSYFSTSFFPEVPFVILLITVS